MFFVNVVLSSLIISLCVWIADKRPDLGGFIVSLPLSTLIVLAVTQFQYGDSHKTTLLAKSIFVAIPSSLLFFIPFLLAEKLRTPFWVNYGAGIFLLSLAFFVHRYFFGLLDH